MKKFVYNKYWGSWSRVIAPGCEVNLTPIPGAVESTWNNHVKPIRVRLGVGKLPGGDVWADELPAHILEQMNQNLEPELIQRLLHEDFMSQIDMNKYRQLCNGGVNLADCLKGQ